MLITCTIHQYFPRLSPGIVFYEIARFWHFNNNKDPNYDANDPDRDRLHIVRPVIDLLNERCKNVYFPGENLSVDESLILFKGRLKFRQYIKTK